VDTRLIITLDVVTLDVVADVDLEEVAARDGLDPARDDVAGHYADHLANFLTDEVNNCPDMPGAINAGAVQAEATCNAPFCILSTHEGDQHVDATGHTWSEATPSAPAVAHVITEAHEAEPDTWSSASRQHYIDTGEYLPAAETEAQR
jgi:hypothetical protein